MLGNNTKVRSIEHRDLITDLGKKTTLGGVSKPIF